MWLISVDLPDKFTIVKGQIFWENNMYKLQRKGDIRRSLEFYMPEMGMSGGSHSIGVSRNAKNKAAALLLMEWLTSSDVEAQFNSQFGTVPMNTKADDSASLLSNEQRKNQVPWATSPFRENMENYFIKNVIEQR